MTTIVYFSGGEKVVLQKKTKKKNRAKHFNYFLHKFKNAVKSNIVSSVENEGVKGSEMLFLTRIQSS